MKMKNLARILIGSALSFMPLNVSENIIKKEFIPEKNTITKLTEKEKKEFNFILYPFRTVELDLPKITNRNVNKNAQKFIENSIGAAMKKYEKEQKAYEEYDSLRKEYFKIVGYNIEIKQYNILQMFSNLDTIKTLTAEDVKKTIEDKREEFNKAHKDELKDFYKKVEYYGRWLADKNTPYYKEKQHKELDKVGMKRIDCISYLLKSMEEGNNGYYEYPSYTEPAGFNELMRELNFEGIYIAQNTISRDSIYMYNTNEGNGYFTNDFIKRIKKYRYPMSIDYLVTDSLFNTINFQKFINETKGFLIIQDGKHTAFLDKGEILESHIFAEPFYMKTFERSNFIEHFDNDNPKSDYQSCVLYVPKGTVNNFMKKIETEYKTKYSFSTKTF